MINRDWFEGWMGQYKRMLRWQDRALASLQGPVDGDDIYDFTYAFFQSCYHLRDWLVSDGVASKDEIKHLFDNSIQLQLCRDICNASKHLQYDRPSIESKPRINREWDHYRGRDMGFALYTDKRRPIPELMNQCVSEWNTFLKSKKLLNNADI